MAQTKEGAKKAKLIHGKNCHREWGLRGGNPMLNAVRDRNNGKGEQAEKEKSPAVPGDSSTDLGKSQL